MTSSIVGLWSLTEFVIKSPSAQSIKWPFGQKPFGYLSYHFSGHMQALLCHETRSPFPKDLEHAHLANDQVKAQAFNESLSYGGEWRRTGNNMAHHVQFATNPQIMGQILTRRIDTLDDKNLILSYDVPSRKGLLEYILSWHKISPSE